MRKLNTLDLVKASRVVKALKIDNEIKTLAIKVQNGKIFGNDAEQLGIELLFAVIGNLGSSESEEKLFEFLSGPFEITPEQVGELEILEMANKFVELIKMEDQEAWRSFFKQLAFLTNRN